MQVYFTLQTTSQEYQDACDLWDLYEDTKNLLMAEVFGDTDKTSIAEVGSTAIETDKEVCARFGFSFQSWNWITWQMGKIFLPKIEIRKKWEI